ncbi:MAG TPA: hypothetical protein PKB12_00960, partial [Elusimicrobiota bacterium]|nr:hypothetical protein [Elusimicrobiota bacterium]
MVGVAHALEVVGQRGVAQVLGVELRERARELGVGVMQAQRDHEGEARPRRGADQLGHALQQRHVGQAPPHLRTIAQLLAEPRAREAVARVDRGAVPEPAGIRMHRRGAVARVRETMRDRVEVVVRARERQRSG